MSREIVKRRCIYKDGQYDITYAGCCFSYHRKIKYVYVGSVILKLRPYIKSSGLACQKRYLMWYKNWGQSTMDTAE